MARSKKDGRRGGNHRNTLGRKDYGARGLENGKPGDGYVDFASASERRFYKKKVSKERRKKSREIGFQEGEAHLKAEEFAPLQMPIPLEYRVYMDIERALKQSESPEDLLKFLVDIAHRSDLLEDRTFLQGLTALAHEQESWIRTPETWHVETGDRGEQFSELARHLLASYDVPHFMDAAWLDNNPVHQRWFKHIAAGKNIRTAAGLPFVLTKKMAHHFLKAPKDYTIVEALRWGQVYGLGGNRRLVEALRETYPIRTLNRHTASGNFWFVEDNFWVGVIRFFIAHPMLDEGKVPSLVDYIRVQKYGDPQRGLEPEHPNFSMKNRTPERLLDQQEAWEEARQRERAVARQREREEARQRERAESDTLQWKPSGINEFRFTLNGKFWCIRELRSTAELKNEGSAMRHCVATYWESCHSGAKSIWTMENLDHNADANVPAKNKVLTIAVDLPYLISEARGKENRLLTEEEKFVLLKWAEQEGLSISADILSQ